MSNELGIGLVALILVLLGIVIVMAWQLFRRRPQTNAADFQVQVDPNAPVPPAPPPAPVITPDPGATQRRFTMWRWLWGLLALALLIFIIWLFASGTLSFRPTGIGDLEVAESEQVSQSGRSARLSGGCKDAWSSTRNVTVANDSPCWGKLPDGSPANITFHTKVFATFWRGGDVYVATLEEGETLEDLIAATLRPAIAGWTKQTVLNMERPYHAPNGANPACVRDLDTGEVLTSLCE